MHRSLYALLFLLSFSLWADHFLTFVIPCYNCEAWISEAVESIYQQSNLRCPFEVICTDDGSTDQTFAVLSSLAEQHPEIRLFRHEKNQGGGAARNTCIRHAKGDLLFCLDADNVLVPNSVDLLIGQMEKTGCDAMAFGQVRYFKNPRKIVGSLAYETPNQQYDLKDLLQRANSPAWSGNYLFTKESFVRAGGYPEQWSTDTYAFGLHQVLSGSKMGYLPNTYYLHRHGIESYYVRESRARRIKIHFFELLLSHQELFTDETVRLVQEHIDLAKNGHRFWDQIWFLEYKLIQLKDSR